MRKHMASPNKYFLDEAADIFESGKCGGPAIPGAREALPEEGRRGLQLRKKERMRSLWDSRASDHHPDAQGGQRA
jgi:hypothetical protein